nr:hypothetical protein [Rhizobium sp. NXC14]
MPNHIQLAAIGRVFVNLFSGVLAPVAYAALSLSPSLLSIFLILLVVALLVGGRAAAPSKDARVFAGVLDIPYPVRYQGISAAGHRRGILGEPYCLCRGSLDRCEAAASGRS